MHGPARPKRRNCDRSGPTARWSTRRDVISRIGARVIVSVAVVALAAVSFSGCGSTGGDATGSIALSTLVEHDADYSGRTVTVTGTVRVFGEGTTRHYWIEDAEQNRVGVEPASSVTDRVGSSVTVTGRFAYDEATGRTITIDTVHPAT